MLWSRACKTTLCAPIACICIYIYPGFCQLAPWMRVVPNRTFWYLFHASPSNRIQHLDQAQSQRCTVSILPLVFIIHSPRVHPAELLIKPWFAYPDNLVLHIRILNFSFIITVLQPQTYHDAITCNTLLLTVTCSFNSLHLIHFLFSADASTSTRLH
jgi:hypothetical protein